MQNRNGACPCCFGDGVLKYPTKIDNSLLTGKTYSSRKIPELMHYSYMECRTCRALFVDDLPDSEFLQSSYNEAEFVSSNDSLFAARTYFHELNRMSLLNTGKLLDIGCSDGSFISIVDSNSEMKVSGIEPSIQAINNSDPSVRLKIEHTVLEKFQGESEFDVLTCFQTVEHLSDLRGLLTKSHELLVDRGRLVLVCHDRLSLVNRILGQRSPIFDIEHLQILNKSAVKALLETNGFGEVRVKSISNTYPVSYWLLLAPIPKFLKRFIDSRRHTRYLSWGIRIRVGNLLAVGRKIQE
jgi:hypothetical protein